MNPKTGSLVSVLVLLCLSARASLAESPTQMLAAEITMTDGAKRELPEVHRGTIKCSAQSFELRLPFTCLASLEFGTQDTKTTVSLSSGIQFMGDVEAFTLQSQGPFGKRNYSSGDIEAVRFSGYTRPDDGKNEGASLDITSDRGLRIQGTVAHLPCGFFDLELRQPRVQRVMFSAESGSTSVETVGGRKITFKRNPEAVLRGEVSGGEFTIPYANITEYHFAKPPTNVVEVVEETEQNPAKKSPFAVVEDKAGNSLEVFDDTVLEAHFGVFDIFYTGSSYAQETNLHVLSAGDFRIIFASKQQALEFLLLPHHLDAQLPDAPASPFPEVVSRRGARLAGSSALGGYRIACANLRAVKRIRHAEEPLGFYDADNCGAEITTVHGRQLHVRSLRFNAKNSLQPGWTSSGRLFRHTARTIPVRLDDGEVVEMEFGKLSIIEPGASYAKDRRAKFVATTGDALSAQVDLEIMKKSTHQTHLTDEGILANVAPRVWVFIPMENIRTVEMTRAGK